jgi:hypothetical protein
MSALLRNLAATTAIVFVAGPTVGQTPSPTLTLRGVGVGADKDAALREALGDLVLQAAGVLLDGPVFTKHKATIVERVVPKAAELAKNPEVLKSEKTTDGKVSVRVRATVDRATMFAKLADAGVPVPKADLPGDNEIGEKVVQFCKDNMGKMIGDGECGTLAVKAMEAAGAKPFHMYKENPGNGDFVWGEPVYALEFKDGKRKRDPADGKARPGDVVQYRDAVFRGASSIFLAQHHTAVVAEVKPNGVLIVYEQNIAGKKEVARSTLRTNELAGGWIRVYRPVGK